MRVSRVGAFARVALGALGALAVSFASREASAFCGFYVSGADAKLFAEATQVVLMREGTRTVLSMQNDYKGPPADFAMVVPVPVVLQKENVKTLSRAIFDKVDKLSAPRLVEYWEQDPCPKPMDTSEGLGLRGIGAGGGGQGFGSGMGRLGGAVRIEAQFEVGEYEIVILSAQDSAGLDAWLRANGYKIPDNAEPALRPYVQAGSKFFVAKVNPAKVRFEDGRATLSPLRFHYDSEKFELPVKLGMLSSSGQQDLVVHILSPNQRFQVANYPNVPIPTNLDVVDATRQRFASFYAALFDRTLAKTPGAVVTEYAWGASSCDPCPGDVQGLSQNDLATLGADVLPSARPASDGAGTGGLAGIGGGGGTPVVRQGAVTVTGSLAPEIVQRVVRQNFGRFRHCYEKGLQQTPTLGGRVVVKLEIDEKGAVASASDGGSDLSDKSVVTCVTKAMQSLTFPAPQSGKVTVTYPLVFQATGGPPLGGRGIGLAGLGSSFVLTRLHARYGKDTLGSDLVFKAAPPIVGGREFRDGAKLEQGAVPSSTNAFQARYAIRHDWKGPIACKEPRRGVWGGPWPGVTGSDKPVAAQKLAYATRTVNVAGFVPGGVPEVGVLPDPAAVVATDIQGATSDGGGGVGDSKGDAAPGDAGAAGDAGDAKSPPVTPPSRCGCTVVGAPEGSALAGLGIGLALVAAARRRARRGG